MQINTRNFSKNHFYPNYFRHSIYIVVVFFWQLKLTSKSFVLTYWQYIDQLPCWATIFLTCDLLQSSLYLLFAIDINRLLSLNLLLCVFQLVRLSTGMHILNATHFLCPVFRFGDLRVPTGGDETRGQCGAQPHRVGRVWSGFSLGWVMVFRSISSYFAQDSGVHLKIVVYLQKVSIVFYEIKL